MHTLIGIITSTNRLQTKNHNTKETYAKSSKVNKTARYDFGTHVELLEILRRLGRERNQYVIRGTPRAGLEYPTRRALENFEDLPKTWVMLDIDKVQLPKPLQTHTYTDAHANFARTFLPTEFQGVRCVWQASASAGVDPSALKMHLWFFLDRPVTCVELREWLRDAPHHDRSVLRAVQPLYTADPIGGPYEGSRLGILPGSLECVSVPDIVASKPDEDLEIPPRPEDSADVDLAWVTDQRQKALDATQAILAAAENPYMDAYRLGAIAGAQEARETWNSGGAWEPECRRLAKLWAAQIAELPGAHPAELYEARIWSGAQWGCARERERLGKRSKVLETARKEVIEATKAKALKRLAKNKGNLNALKEAAEALRGQATVEELSEASGLSEADAKAVLGEVAQFDSDKWQEGLKTSGKFSEVIVANDLNYLRIFSQYPGFANKLRFNVRSNEVEALDGHPCFKPGNVSMNTAAMPLVEWLGSLGCADVKSTAVSRVFEGFVASIVEQYDPFIVAIDDATERTGVADTWLIKHMGAKDTPYIRQIGLKALVAGVARAYEPGCQVDTMLVFQGGEGIGKTYTTKMLGSVIPRGYTQLNDMRDKDAIVAMNASVVVEMGELRALQVVKEQEHFKAFMSVGTDRFRRPYAKAAEDIPRRSIIIGTTNPAEYLTGHLNRRIWPVECRGGVHMTAEDALALWRDARVAYAQGERWWLEGEAVKATQRKLTERARDRDPYEEAIELAMDGKNKVMHQDIMRLVSPDDVLNMAVSRRVGKSMRALGWVNLHASGRTYWRRSIAVPKAKHE